MPPGQVVVFLRPVARLFLNDDVFHVISCVREGATDKSLTRGSALGTVAIEKAVNHTGRQWEIALKNSIPLYS